MVRTFTRCALSAAALISFAAGSLISTTRASAGEYADYYSSAGQACVNCQTPQPHQPVLFYNYYVPGAPYGVAASMYPAPYPTPPVIGHVYYTYQPFMPHEFLYTHHRNYTHRDGFLHPTNRTGVKWTSGHYRRTSF